MRRRIIEYLFVSYVRENKEVVQRLVTDLTARGEKVWWDSEILPGQDWKREINKAIKSSYAVIACFSEETDKRGQSGMFPELREAIKIYRELKPGSIFIIPVRLSECSVPDFQIDDVNNLSALQYVDLFPESNWDSGVEKICRAVRTSPNYP